ncbi:alpha/beta fold hydrolase [Sediminitomix flava]|uniref:Pimeloyl-ACP methyl ester carboxylesterase n=1 Tax=Sediminitomix flava TaxID=379075 RepID=A0A315ZH73_SEDFL|nr:alpha/beta hydrolase [Sediminitomix flava]PWJ44861.1 pimeloyl-ACP methyl ester carboxylesterase [Sediminitomix flava]
MTPTDQEIYFLSGTMCDDRLWEKVWNTLPENISPKYIDTTACHSFQEIDETIESALPQKKVTLVGFSMRGYAALRFAINFPDRLDKLILIASSAKGLDRDELKLRSQTIEYLKNHPYKGISILRVRQFLAPENQQNQEYADTIKAMDKSLGKEVLIRQLTATSERVSLEDELSKISIPVLLVGSDHDSLVKWSDLEEMNSKIPNAKLVKIEKAGHMIPLENAEQLSDELITFL